MPHHMPIPKFFTRQFTETSPPRLILSNDFCGVEKDDTKITLVDAEKAFMAPKEPSRRRPSTLSGLVIYYRTLLILAETSDKPKVRQEAAHTFVKLENKENCNQGYFVLWNEVSQHGYRLNETYDDIYPTNPLHTARCCYIALTVNPDAKNTEAKVIDECNKTLTRLATEYVPKVIRLQDRLRLCKKDKSHSEILYYAKMADKLKECRDAKKDIKDYVFSKKEFYPLAMHMFISTLLEDPVLTKEQQTYIILNTLLSEEFLKESTKIKKLIFKVLQKVKDPLMEVLPIVMAKQAKALAAQLDEEHKYDQKTFWRKADANKPIKSAVLKTFATHLTSADELKQSDNRVVDAFKKTSAATDLNSTLSGTGWGWYTSWNTVTGSRTNDFITTALVVTRGLGGTVDNALLTHPKLKYVHSS